MLGVFQGLLSFLKRSSVSTEGIVFRLHCKATVLFLISASILLGCRQYFGDPIYCMQSSVKQTEIVDNFCWIHSTFVLPDAWNEPVGINVPHPGIDKATPGKNRKYHVYYQWVAFVLLLQGIFFYAPHYLWKVWEKGTIKALTINLNLPILPPEENRKNCELLSHALRIHWGQFSSYLRKYIICEFLTLLNVIFQMSLLDAFLGGAFSTFGIKVLQWSEWDQEHRTDPLVQAFPRMTKCIFHYYGSAGSIQVIDALCMLPLNVLNEKIFIFLWFWMVLLCWLITFVLIYRFMLCVFPILRYAVIKLRAPLVSTVTLDTLLQKAKVSDWFMLYLLSKNISSQNYISVINHLTDLLEEGGRRTPFRNEETTFV